MIVQVETVSTRSSPDEYLDVFETETRSIEWSEGRIDDVEITRTDMLDPVIDDIGTDCIVQDGTDHYRAADDAEWVIRVYDGYNE